MAHFPVVIIGAGHSGLSLSFLLKQKNCLHVVFESRVVGSAWDNRWDSFRLNTPSSTISLPNRRWDITDCETQSYPTHHEVKQFLKNYVDDFDLPVREGFRVDRVHKFRQNENLFCLECFDRSIDSTTTITADKVVVATGEHSKRKFPNFVKNLFRDILVIHSEEYRNSKNLPTGGILIIGGGQSGAQICDELLSQGRQNVFWSISGNSSNIRRFRGKDYLEWWDIGGILHNSLARIPLEYRKFFRNSQFPLIGSNGRVISLKDMTSRGAVLLDRAVDAQGDFVLFGRDVCGLVKMAVEGTRAQLELLTSISNKYFLTYPHEDCPDDTLVPSEAIETFCYNSDLWRLDLRATRVHTVICATGHEHDFSWLDVPNATDPKNRRVISPAVGIFFLGLFTEPRVSSSCLCNGGRDAGELLPFLIGDQRTPQIEKTTK